MSLRCLVREWALTSSHALDRLERCAPVRCHGASGVLPRLGRFAEIAQHGIDAALQLQVALPDRVLQAFPFSIRAQSLELLVWIEDQRRPAETPRNPGAFGMHS